MVQSTSIRQYCNMSVVRMSNLYKCLFLDNKQINKKMDYTYCILIKTLLFVHDTQQQYATQLTTS